MRTVKYALLGFVYHVKCLFCRFSSLPVACLVVMAGTASAVTWSFAPDGSSVSRLVVGSLWAAVPFVSIAFFAHYYQSSEADTLTEYVEAKMENWFVAALNAAAIFIGSGVATTVALFVPARPESPSMAFMSLWIGPFAGGVAWATLGVIGVVLAGVAHGLNQAFWHYNKIGRQLANGDDPELS